MNSRKLENIFDLISKKKSIALKLFELQEYLVTDIFFHSISLKLRKMDQ